jgi:5-methylcytosine-specific restriction endonuclease McrA
MNPVSGPLFFLETPEHTGGEGASADRERGCSRWAGFYPRKEATMFSETVKAQAYRRSGGRCECIRKGHGHTGRCATRLTQTSGEYHHVTAVAKGGSDGLSNCEYLCKPCHRQTPSYGR